MTGAELHSIRKRKGIPLRTLADLIGAGEKEISEIETGGDVPDYYEAAIRRALRMPTAKGYTGVRTSSGVRF